jgi:peptidyl-prolyl cis-trans isomerase SurA
MSRLPPLSTRSALLVWLIWFPTALAAAQEEIVDAIAAQVGSKIVLLSDVARVVGAQEEAMREMDAPESEIAKLRADGLERVIENRLIETVVERAELFASDEEVTSTIASIAAENGLSVEQLYASVAYHGMTVELYRDQIKRDLERRSAVNAMVGSQVTIEEEMLLDLYNQRFRDQPKGGVAVHVRQIVVSHGQPSGRSAAAACAMVEEAHARIEAGEDFQVVASEVSEVAPQSGGDIGVFHLNEVAGWMHDALVKLEPGQTSAVLELPFGCSILELVERRDFEPVSYEQARDRLSQEVWQREMEKNYREWLEELRADTYIDRRGFFADAGARFGGGGSGSPTGTP